MRQWIFGVTAALALAGSSAAYVAPGTAACLRAIDARMDKDPKFDAFLPTEYLDGVRILMWLGPYSKGIQTEVATMILIEGKARLKEDHSKSEDVTAQCGLTDDKVLVEQVHTGHGLPDPQPVQ
jgi:hypothetical protein